MYTLICFTVFYYVFVFAVFGFSNNIRLSIAISLLPLAVISGFRYDVGFDYDSYSQYFYLSQYDSSIYIDYSFRILSQIIYSVGGNEQFLFLIYSLISIILLYATLVQLYKKYELNSVFICGFILAYYAFYFYLSLNQIRSSLAALFIFYAFIIPTKNIKTFSLLMLGVFFHSASVFIVPIYYFIDKVKIKLLYFIFPVVGLFAFLGAITNSIHFILTVIDSRFITYFNSEYFTPKTGLEKIYTLATTLSLLIVWFFSVNLLGLRYLRLLKMCFFFLIFRLMSMDALIFARISDFIKPISILVVSLTIYYLSKKVRPKFIFLFYISITFILVIFNIILGSNISELPNYIYQFNFCIFGHVCPI